MIEQFEVTLPAPSGEQKRRAYVYLPHNGGEHPAPQGEEERYPVVYMFDGQTAFFDEDATYGESWRMGAILDSLQAKVIVAAVACDEKDRLTEYSPFPFRSEYGSSEGKGEAYLSWLVHTFKPLIDAWYPTQPGRESTYIMGSSMGGLMVLFALSRYAEVFGGGMSLSPSVWVSPQGCAEMIASADWAKCSPALYLSYGAKELRTHGERQTAGLSACLEALMKKGINFTFRFLKQGAHNEKTWREQVPMILHEFALTPPKK